MTSNNMSKPRPSPSVKRPSVSRCIVVPKVAVTSTWRVLWFVAAVATPSVELTAPAAPLSAHASFVLKRSEMKTEPSPISSARPTSVTRSRGVAECPANP